MSQPSPSRMANKKLTAGATSREDHPSSQKDPGVPPPRRTRWLRHVARPGAPAGIPAVEPADRHLACMRGGSDAFCMGTPRSSGFSATRAWSPHGCAEHADVVYPPPGLVGGVYTFVLLSGWSDAIANQARD